MHLTTFMDHLRLLEGRGHARRIDNPTDGRSYLVTLTADGLAAHREANRRFELAYNAFIDTLEVGEADARETVRAMRVAADAARSDGASSFGHPAGAVPTHRNPVHQ